MANEVKRLGCGTDRGMMCITLDDAALLQAVVDAAREDSAPKLYKALAALDARIAEKERT